MSERRDGDAPSDFHESFWTFGIKDHNDQPVEFAWVSRDKRKASIKRPCLPFQVYVLDSVPKTGAYGKLPELFARWMDWGGVFEFQDRGTCHFEIYRSPFANVIACVEHQRREIEHRNSKNGWSHLVDNWADVHRLSDVCVACTWDMGYVLVMDRDDWTAEGVLQVTFAQPPHSETFANHDVNCTNFGSSHTAVLAVRGQSAKDRPGFFREILSHCGRFKLCSRRRKRVKKDLKHAHKHGKSKRAALLERRRHEAEQTQEKKDAVFLADCARSRAQLLTNTQNQGVIVNNHFDDFGWPISTVWDPRHNERRPELSFTIYVADDTPPISPQVLYASLDQNTPKESSWTLDIVWRVANMSTAMQHYSQEARRWPSRRAEARHYLTVFRERVFRCAVGHIIPEEILQNIIDLSNLRRPTKEDFDSTCATRNHVFMYLDARTLGFGPQIAIADPRVSSTQVIAPDMQKQRWSKAPWAGLESSSQGDTALEV